MTFSGYVRLQQVASCMVRGTRGEGESGRRRVAHQPNGVRFAEKKRADDRTRTAYPYSKLYRRATLLLRRLTLCRGCYFSKVPYSELR
jgi:hypothetical protein